MNSLIVATCITSDRAAIIGDAVRSTRGIADVLLLVDVGITDATEDVARAAASEFGLPVIRVDARPWKDCGYARQAALDAASRAGGAWAITVDTDERLESQGEDVRAVLMATSADVLTAWHVTGSYAKERAIRLPPTGHWIGRVHECYAHAGETAVFERLRFSELEKTPAALLRRCREHDLPGLLAEIDDHRDEPRWQYYLGQTHETIARLGEGTYDLAVDAYLRCAEISGHRQQSAFACYRAAECLGHLRRWPDALRAALAGLERDSCCAECAAYAALCCLQLGRPHEALAWALAAKAVASVDTPVRGPWRHPAAYGRGPDAIAEAARKVIAEVTANGA